MNCTNGPEAIVYRNRCIVEHECYSELRDVMHRPQLELSDIKTFMLSEVPPRASIEQSSVMTGYETNFIFYMSQPSHWLQVLPACMLAVLKKTEWLLSDIIRGRRP